MKPISTDLLLDSLFEGVYFVDTERQISYWNSGAERISGYSKSDVLGTCCADNILRHTDGIGHELCHNGCPLAATIIDGNHREAEIFLFHKLGYKVPVSIRTSPVRDEHGTIIGAVEVFSDNSSSLQILQEFEKLKQDVYLDQLTGVGNRRYGEMILSARMFDWHANQNPFGLLFMDIDHFKVFNDRFGHMAGDQVLIMVANAISVSLRKMDVVARWGGEEFIVVLPGATSVTVKAVAERIRSLVENSFVAAKGEKLKVTISIGAAMSRAEDAEYSIVNRADELMYRSKKQGRNCVTQEE